MYNLQVFGIDLIKLGGDLGCIFSLNRFRIFIVIILSWYSINYLFLIFWDLRMRVFALYECLSVFETGSGKTLAFHFSL